MRRPSIHVFFFLLLLLPSLGIFPASRIAEGFKLRVSSRAEGSKQSRPEGSKQRADERMDDGSGCIRPEPHHFTTSPPVNDHGSTRRPCSSSRLKAQGSMYPTSSTSSTTTTA
ncbi:hypothetical protein BZA05DRAFT_436187 [Tricharina praecox]|uniref:uncharacterized protein n=1 Tax=Tricharina praecox TaxID=43433 RepID=UPI00221FEB30|nr:uncharacterized protein BZA05DRAFT_436187 [Tricharina praecox]KAI5852346.1 hypothetical protein BZA05DRAFT_436187 [Tricharina praecox]